MRFSKQEEDWLRQAVDRFGSKGMSMSKWAEVRNMYAFDPCRTPADLRTKWSNMQK